MTLPKSVLSNKVDIMKEREGSRLSRYLRILFGQAKFGFSWTNEDTSFTDGKDIYVIYDVQRPHCRPFDPNEQRIIRKGHAIHERGHLEYDCITDYSDWLAQNRSMNQAEWMANEKYPIAWLQFFGNVLMDARMELLTMTEKPSTEEYIDFVNYEWTFGIREEGVGKDPIHDFRCCFMSRSYGMTPVTDWLPDAVDLVDSVDALIAQARRETSTESCLEVALQIMKRIWPDLLEWMKKAGKEPGDFEYNDHHQSANWGSKQEVENNAKRALAILASTPAPKEPSDKKPDFSKMLRLEEKQHEKEEQEVDAELAPFQERTEGVEIQLSTGSTTSEVDLGAYYRSDLSRYEQTYQSIRRHIEPTARMLSGLLKPISDKKRAKQREGSIQIGRAWRADLLSDPNVFERIKKGTPAKEARILLQTDISGSTQTPDFQGSRRIDEMRRASALVIEACEKAGIPIAAYGFTELDLHDGRKYRNKIFPFKPFEQFGTREKGLIGGMEPEVGNRDTVALQWSVSELLKYREDICLLIMLSDGQPCFASGEDKDTMRNIVIEAEKKGIDVLCLYIGPRDTRSIQTVQHMYPGRSIIVEKNLTRDLTTHVQRIIRSRK